MEVEGLTANSGKVIQLYQLQVKFILSDDDCRLANFLILQRQIGEFDGLEADDLSNADQFGLLEVVYQTVSELIRSIFERT